MGDREGYIFNAQTARNFAGGAGQSQRRFAAGLPDDFNINPAHAARPAGSQRLHGSFLGSKASGESLATTAVRFAIGNLRWRENAFQKKAATTLNRRFDAVDLHDVNAQADNHQNYRPQLVTSQ